MMNTMNRPRTGFRKLNRRLAGPLFRCCDRPLLRPALHLAFGRRPPRPNHLAEACRLLKQYYRLRVRSLKRWPEEHPVARWRRLEREAADRFAHAELERALAKVYGASSPPGPEPEGRDSCRPLSPRGDRHVASPFLVPMRGPNLGEAPHG
jgi:hypothetical protein